MYAGYSYRAGRPVSRRRARNLAVLWLMVLAFGIQIGDAAVEG